MAEQDCFVQGYIMVWHGFQRYDMVRLAHAQEYDMACNGVQGYGLV